MEPALGFEPRTDGLQNRRSLAQNKEKVVIFRKLSVISA